MPTLGEILRTEREKQQISVKDVEKGTSIRAIYIQAIEDGKYNVLPGEVYLKGFIRNYATYLGLNPQEMMEIYRQNQEVQPQIAPTAPAKPERRETRKSSSAGRWLIALLLVVLIAGGAWAAMTYLNEPAPAPPKQQPKVQTPASPAPQVLPAPPPAQTPVAKAVAVTAKYTGECWSQVIADGREVYEGIPKVGETLSWNANQTMTIKLGNAAAVAITYNGQPQGRLGGDGEVITKTFSVNTTNTPR